MGCRGPLDKNHTAEGESGDHGRRRGHGRMKDTYVTDDYHINSLPFLYALSKNYFLQFLIRLTIDFLLVIKPFEFVSTLQ